MLDAYRYSVSVICWRSTSSCTARSRSKGIIPFSRGRNAAALRPRFVWSDAPEGFELILIVDGALIVLGRLGDVVRRPDDRRQEAVAGGIRIHAETQAGHHVRGRPRRLRTPERRVGRRLAVD